MENATAQPFTDRLISRTPWWAISIGLHAVLALVMVYVVALGSSADDEEAVVVHVAKKLRPLDEFDPPKDLPPTNKILDLKKTSEETVFRKTNEDRKVETRDEDFREMARGDDTSLVDKNPFKSRNPNSSIGLQGGGGGKFGTRIGGLNDRSRDGGGGPDTQGAVREALKWLARHQGSKGSWSVQGYSDRCGSVAKYTGRCIPNPGYGDYEVGVTGLALLAFLGAGYSHHSRDLWDGIRVGDVVRRGLEWLISQQDTDGCVGSREVHRHLYNHLIAALALCEAYGLTGSLLTRDAAQKSLDFTIAAQNPDRGWRYVSRQGENDTSVTGWGAMVLKSAEISGLSVPRTAYDGIRTWLDLVTSSDYYRVGYDRRDTGTVYDEHNKRFNGHEALTAIGMMARIFMDRNRGDARLAGGAQLLLRDLPKWDGNDIDFYYWYNGSLAMFQFDGPSGTGWLRWNGAMKEAVVHHQNVNAGCKTGSWEPIDRWSCEGGRVYSTALNCLTLEVYYRYANVFGAR